VQGSAALLLCTAARPLYTTFTNIFGASFLKRRCDRTLGPYPFPRAAKLHLAQTLVVLRTPAVLLPILGYVGHQIEVMTRSRVTPDRHFAVRLVAHPRLNGPPSPPRLDHFMPGFRSYPAAVFSNATVGYYPR
jgi:hypothetical protein